MKNAKRSVIITAILAIIMCASLAAGATFALFSSSSSVNIAVTSGNVEVTASVVDIQKSYVDDKGETVNSSVATLRLTKEPVPLRSVTFCRRIR